MENTNNYMIRLRELLDDEQMFDTLGRPKLLYRDHEVRMEMIDSYGELYIEKKKQGKDKGADGKYAEILVRDYVNSRMSIMDFKPRKAGKVDANIISKKQKFKLEVKTGAGTHKADFNIHQSIEEQVFADVDFIVFCIKFNPKRLIEEQMVVFTKEQWFEGLKSYNDKGLATWYKAPQWSNTDGTYKMDLNTYQSSKKKMAHIQAMMDNQPTLKEWYENIRG